MITFEMLNRQRSGMKRFLGALGICFGLLWSCAPAFPQVNTGRISGVITDESGGVIPGATVTVTDVARGVARPLTTDDAGQYSAPNLTPGMYTLAAEATGFQKVERGNIMVGVGGDIRVDLSLTAGTQNQTITVTAELPVINTTNAQNGGTLENHVLNDLPINGRNYLSLTATLPGVMLMPGGGTDKQSTNGGRTTSDNFMVDGLYQTQMYNGESSLGSPSEAGDTTILPLDAIQEVDLVQNPSAEYGWQPGVQVNVGLKSGTNALHGTAYAYGRDASLTAKNAFAAVKPDSQFEQFGASLGGPIRKDKIFYFTSYEGTRLSIGSPTSISEPTTADLGNNPTSSVPDAIAAINTAHAAAPPLNNGVTTLSPLAVGLLGCNPASPDITSTSGATVALACGPGAAGAPPSLFGNSSNSTTVSTNIPNVGGNDNGLGKIDYRINDKHSLNGEYYFGQYGELAQSSTPLVQQYWRELLAARTQVGRVVEIWTPSSTWVNEARWGYDHDSRPVTTGECAENLDSPDYGATYGFTTTASGCGFPTTTITGFQQLGFGNDRVVFDTDIQGADSVSHTVGKHQIKFGLDIRAASFKGSKYTDSLKGTIAFGTNNLAAFSGAKPLEDFLAGVPSSESIRFGSPIRSVASQMYGLFAQDDWRVTRKLTLNLGLRWEYETPATVAGGLSGNFSPTQGVVNSGVLYKSSPKQFGPRLGIVWDPFGKGSTIFRAGGSIFYAAQIFQTFMSGVDLTTVPSGAVDYAVNGAATQPPPNGIAAVSITTSGSIVNGSTPNGTSALPWTTNVSPFPLATLQCGNGLVPVDPVPGAPAKNPPPCNTQGASPLWTTYTSTWTVNVQQALPGDISLNVAYVGTHGTGWVGPYDLNQPLPGPISGVGAPSSSSTTSLELQRSPYYNSFPFLSQIKYAAPIEDSNYNGLQLTLIKRITNGLSFTSGYTFSHALDYSTVSTGGGTLFMDSTRPNLDYGTASIDVRNRFTLIGSYALPGRKAPAQMLEGWQVNASLNLLGKLPLNPIDSTDDISGTGVGQDRWTMVGSPSSFKIGPAPVPCYGFAGGNVTINGTVYSFPTSKFAANCASVTAMPAACVSAAAAEPNSPASVLANGNSTSPAAQNTALYQLYTLGCYAEGNAVIVPPAQGTYGTMLRDALRANGVRLLDLSVTKTWKLKERYSAEFRAECFNLFNRTQYANPSANLGSPSTFGKSPSTPDVAAGDPLVGSGGPRELQLALRLTF